MVKKQEGKQKENEMKVYNNVRYFLPVVSANTQWSVLSIIYFLSISIVYRDQVTHIYSLYWSREHLQQYS